MPDKPEKIGKYELSEQIGVGGFGAVYRGRDPFIKRTVAIKTCQLNDEEVKSRFFREAELAGNLHHRNITTIYDFGVENGIPYIVQEFLTGEDLDRIIKRGDKMSISRKIDILMAIADGLAYAHHKSIMHRDIKPANIRILEDGAVKIMDFGIAKSLHSESSLTQTGITLGTSAYLAPEQIRGETLDGRTDIFALGVIAYELLTLRRPFRGEHLSTVLYKILNEAPEPITTIAPEVPLALAAVVLRAMEKNIESRYPSMETLRQDLQSVSRDLAGGPSAPAATPRLSGAAPRDPDATVQTPSRGMPNAPITPPSGALARAPAYDDRTPTVPSRRPREADLELVNFRDPDQTPPDRKTPEEEPAVGRKGSRGLWFAAGMVLVLAIGAAYVFLPRTLSPPAAPAAPRPAVSPQPAPTAPIVFPQPQVGQEPAATQPARPTPAQPPENVTEKKPEAAADQKAEPAAEKKGQVAEAQQPANTAEKKPETPETTEEQKPEPVREKKGETVSAQEPEPPRPPRRFRIQFSSVPESTLYVDGKRIGPSIPARTVELVEGKHTVRFEQPDLPVYEKQFHVGPNGAPPIAYRFPVGYLVIQAPEWVGASVLIDLKFKGILSGEKSFQLKSGSHRVTLSREGVSPYTADVIVPEGDKKTWTPPPPTPQTEGAS
ncbi:MAG TPA: protein kinase [Thermoanaerobaculia bacterium]|nr:protein kinase [Thermoanaerobaculia bacterium]